MPLIEEGGLVCEFGVGGGRSRMIQEVPLSVSVHGFDTFTGEYTDLDGCPHILTPLPTSL
jgi:hypothetical protein